MSPVEQVLFLVQGEWLSGEASGVGARASGQGGSNLPPGPKTAIDKAARFQGVERGFILREMIRLATHRPVPVEAQPGKVGKDGGLVFRAAAGLVNVFHPQQHLAAMRTGRIPDMEGRQGMAEMKVPGGRRRKPRDKFPSAHSIPFCHVACFMI